MKQVITSLKSKLVALAPRERWMVLLAGLAVLVYLLHTLLIAPVSTKNQAIKLATIQTQDALSGVSQQISALAQTPVNQQNQLNQAKIEALQVLLDEQQVQLTDIETGLVLPTQMPHVLKSLMQVHRRIRLVHMETLAPTPYLTQQQANGIDKTGHETGLYKHAFSITLAGSYLDLMHYATALQQLSKQVLWDKAMLETKAYPTNELTLHLYTLSMDKTWLSI